METKIIFNGNTYTNVESMPEEVRQAYQQALAHLADADKNGIPDIMERGGAGNVIAIQQSSINFNGREYKSVGEMPAIVRRLFEMAMGQADANRKLQSAGVTRAKACLEPFDAAQDKLRRRSAKGAKELAETWRKFEARNSKQFRMNIKTQIPNQPGWDLGFEFD